MCFDSFELGQPQFKLGYPKVYIKCAFPLLASVFFNMPYMCGHCKTKDDDTIKKKSQELAYEKLSQEYKMLERMTEENQQRKLELERQMCKIPYENCEDCKNWCPTNGEVETETELHRIMSQNETRMENYQDFDGRDFVGTREAIFFLYYFYQQVSRGYLEMVGFDTNIQKEDCDEDTKEEYERSANRIFYNLRTSLANFMNDFAGVKMAL